LSKLTIIDFLSKGSSHLNFNKSFIQAIPSNYEIKNFIGNESHFKKLELEGIKANTVNKDHQNWSIRVLSIFFKSILNSEKNITILTFENYLFPILGLIFMPFLISKNIVMVVHNNVPGLSKGGLKTKAFKLFVSICKPKLICLTKSMKDEMIKLGYQKNTVWIPHMNYKHLKTSSNPDISFDFPDDKINIVLLGRQAKIFVNHTLPKISNSKFENILFHVFHDNVEEYSFSNLLIHKIRPSQAEYQLILNTCDFVFFPDLEVSLRPSGILLDCISNYCPIIAPSDGHFKEFENYVIGYSYKNESLIHRLQIIDAVKSKRITFKKDAFKSCMDKTSITQFSEKLNAIFSTV